MATLIVEIGWCGLGYSAGLIPEVRLGLLRLAWCRGLLIDRIRGWGVALKAAAGDTPEDRARGR